MHLTCGCLNIHVHAKFEPAPVDVDTLQLRVDEINQTGFFLNGVSSVVLDVGGLIKEQPSLTKTVPIGDWNVNLCGNCGAHTHAVHCTQGLDRVLVSQTLEKDASVLASKMGSENYSQFLRIVLDPNQKRPLSTVENNGNVVVARNLSENFAGTAMSLQQQLNRWIVKEQVATDERIRIYSEQQKAAMKVAQRRAQQEYDLMLQILQDMDQLHVQNDLNDALLEVPTDMTPPVSPASIASEESQKVSAGDFMFADGNDNIGPVGGDDFINDEEAAELDRGDIVPSHCKPIMRPRSFSRPLQGSRSGKRKLPIHPTRRLRSLDSDGIFSLDEFDNNQNASTDNAPAYHSDDDIDCTGDRDDVFTSGEGGPTAHNVSYMHFARSLPVTMPAFPFKTGSRTNSRDYDDDDDDDAAKVPENTEEIAASIKALARSVRCQDGTEMFGDLPRPRLNTFN